MARTKEVLLTMTKVDDYSISSQKEIGIMTSRWGYGVWLQLEKRICKKRQKLEESYTLQLIKCRKLIEERKLGKYSIHFIYTVIISFPKFSINVIRQPLFSPRPFFLFIFSTSQSFIPSLASILGHIS